MPREEVLAQTTNELVGTWTFISITLKRDGKDDVPFPIEKMSSF
jgi:hypothetical protein